MAATLQQLLARKHLSWFYYVIVHGVDAIFSNVKCPPAWEDTPGSQTVTIAGETYRWIRSLDMDATAISPTSRMIPKAGYVSPAQCALLFTVRGMNRDTRTDPWLKLITPPRQRADINRAILQRSLAVNGTSMVATPTSGWPSTGWVHVGTECNYYGSKSAGGFSSLTRGAFRSAKKRHDVLIGEQFVAGAGAETADVPLAWEGRGIEVWEGYGVRTRHLWVPFAAAPLSDTDLCIHQGKVLDIDLVKGTHHIRLSTVDLAQYRADDVASRMPRGKALVSDQRGHNKGELVVVDGYSNLLTWDVFPTTGADAAEKTIDKDDVQLQHFDGVTGNLVDDLYYREEIERHLGYTISQQMSGVSPFGAEEIHVIIQMSASGIVTMWFTAVNTANKTEKHAFTIHPDKGDKHNLWLELGFETAKVMDPLINVTSGDVVWGPAIGDRPVPAFRWPVHKPGSKKTHRRLYYELDTYTLPFMEAPGWVDDNGTAIDGHVLIGEHELVSFGDVKTSPKGAKYLEVKERGLAGTSGAEEVYIETASFQRDIEDIPVLAQVLAFPRTSVYRAELYLAHGGSDVAGTNGPYDQGWAGCGLALPESYYDADSFVRLSEVKAAKRPMIVITEPNSLRDALRGEYIAEQVVPVAAATGSGFKITAAEAAHPKLGDVVTQVLDASWIKSVGQGELEVEASHSKIINEAKIETNWNPASGKYRTRIKARDQTSYITYNQKQKLSFRLNSYHSGVESEQAVQNVTQDLWAQYGDPYHVIRVDVTRRAVWLWPLGSIVELNHPSVPNLVTVGRGVTQVLCRLVAMQPFYRPVKGADGKALTARLFLIPATGRFPRWAPSAKIVTKADATHFTIATNIYTHSTTGRTDADGFKADEYALFYKAGDEGSAEVGRIKQWTGASLELYSPGVTLTAPLRMRPVGFAHVNATEHQQNYAAMSEGSGLDGGVPAMEYS